MDQNGKRKSGGSEEKHFPTPGNSQVKRLKMETEVRDEANQKASYATSGNNNTIAEGASEDLAYPSSGGSKAIEGETGGTCKSNIPSNEASPGSQRVITADRLEHILQTQNVLSILLVECRERNSFEKGHIFHSINVSPVENSIIRFTSNGDVINFIQNQCPSLLDFLSSPGFHKDIIVYDEACTFENISKSVRTWMDVILKWNSGTNTCIRLLQGGYQSFAARFPSLVTTQPIMVPVSCQHPQDIVMLEQYHSSGFFDGSSSSKSTAAQGNDRNEFMNLNKNYVATMVAIVDGQRRVKSLKAIKKILFQEKVTKIRIQYGAAVEVNYNCSICHEVLFGKVFQCPSGHICCKSCSDRITSCPECGTDFGYDPNWTLQGMVSSRRTKCVYFENGCRKTVKCSQLATHIRYCDKKPENLQVHEIQKSINKLNLLIEGNVVDAELLKMKIANCKFCDNMTDINQVPTVPDFGAISGEHGNSFQLPSSPSALIPVQHGNQT